MKQMTRSDAILSLAIIFLVNSCTEKEPITAPPAISASYSVNITMNWSAPAFGFPSNAHFTRFIGMIHKPDTFLWGQQATPGLEYIAEVGSAGRMNNEIDSIIGKQQAWLRFGMNPPSPSGAIDSVFNFTTTYSCFSFASMVAPSPDWFIGLNSLNLLENNQWVNDKTADLFVYDAGTEDGDVFDYDNPATVPQNNITVLTPSQSMSLANGNPTIVKIGTVRFTKN